MVLTVSSCSQRLRYPHADGTLGKGRTDLPPALEGKQRCPLIVRPTSEDVVTGNLCQVLRILNSRWWLSDLLNMALGCQRFRRQFHRRLRIEPWENRPRYPRELLPWEEGSTQVDMTVRWENSPTTVYIEAKYGSDLSLTTAGNNGHHRYPADQLIRNIRVGLYECGWFEDARLFDLEPRDLVVILWCPAKGHELVRKYRDADQLRASIPHSNRLVGLPRMPFVGELSYDDISTCSSGNDADSLDRNAWRSIRSAITCLSSWPLFAASRERNRRKCRSRTSQTGESPHAPLFGPVEGCFNPPCHDARVVVDTRNSLSGWAKSWTSSVPGSTTLEIT